MTPSREEIAPKRETFAFANQEEGWMRFRSANTLAYVSDAVGDVVLVGWADGGVTILREGGADEAKRVITGVSAECLGKIDELRGRMNPDEVALAAVPDSATTTRFDIWKAEMEKALRADKRRSAAKRAKKK